MNLGKFLRVEQQRYAIDVAEAAGLNPTVLSNMERGRWIPTESELQRWAKGLKYPGDPRRLLAHVPGPGNGEESKLDERERKAAQAAV